MSARILLHSTGPGTDSNAPLPPLWIAASVKTRDHDNGANFDAKKESEGKFAQTRAMYISKNRRELVRILLQTEDGSLHFFEKANPEAAMPGLVPILSV